MFVFVANPTHTPFFFKYLFNYIFPNFNFPFLLFSINVIVFAIDIHQTFLFLFFFMAFLNHFKSKIFFYNPHFRNCVQSCKNATKKNTHTTQKNKMNTKKKANKKKQNKKMKTFCFL